MKSILNSARLAPLLVVVLAACGSGSAQADNTLSCDDLSELMARYGQVHVSQGHLERALPKRFAELYVSRVDPAKTLLLASEREALKKDAIKFLQQARTGQCGFLESVHARQTALQKEMEAYTAKLTANPKLTIDKSVQLESDSDKRPVPKTKAEQAQLRRRIVHFQLANYVASGTALPKAKEKLNKRYKLISKRVAEQKRVDLMSNFLDAWANAHDPHTTYFSQDMLEDFQIGMRLSLEGIGASLRQIDGYTQVHDILPGGAAAREGSLKTKDRITAVAQDGEEAVDVVDMSLRDVVKLIRGKKGTKVQLTVLRKAEKSATLKITIVRDKIDLTEQAAKLRWETIERGGRKLKLAVLELPSFYGGRGPDSRQATDDVVKLLEEVNEKKADGLVLDLAMNSGGLLQYAVDISGYFIRKGAVVGVEGRGDRQILEDEDGRIQYRGPLVVHTSRLSASASEILAGAIKDYGRGVIVGDDHTFGKGSVQQVMDVAPGKGALKVTTSLFFRPGGASTQGSGVQADIIVPSVFGDPSYGEAQQKFALSEAKTRPFPGKQVNGSTAADSWTPVSAATIARLRARSKARIAANAEFAKVKKSLEKAKRSADFIKVSDILDDEDNKTEEERDAERKAKKGKLTPQAKEALEVLADLVAGPDLAKATPAVKAAKPN